MPSMLTLIATLVTVAAAQSADPGHCFPHSPGSGPVPTPDNSAAFLGFKNFSTVATSASTPQGYFTTSKDQSYTYNDASLFAGYKELQTYDTQACEYSHEPWTSEATSLPSNRKQMLNCANE
jgi:hypothetical protein